VRPLEKVFAVWQLLRLCSKLCNQTLFGVGLSTVETPI